MMMLRIKPLGTRQFSYSRRLGSLAVFVVTLLSYSANCQQTSAQNIDPQVIRDATRSVVAISRVRKGTQGDPASAEFIPNQLGCGIVIRADGLVITNRHLLGKPDENQYFVWLATSAENSGKRVLSAKVLAADPWSDLAVLKIEASGLIPMPLTQAAQPARQGQGIAVIGMPVMIIRQGQGSAASGIVANLNRKLHVAPRVQAANTSANSLHEYGTLIQSSAGLAGSTSGGAMIDSQGQLIGLTTALAPMQSDPSSTFAIPVDDTFRKAIKSLSAAKLPEFGFLGVGPRDLSENQRNAGRNGVQIAEVVPGTPAEKAGFRFGDLITHVNGVAVDSPDELMKALGSKMVGEEIHLFFIRNAFGEDPGQPQTAHVRLGKKWIQSNRTSFQSVSPRVWRGLSVDYPTAIPDFQLRGRFVDAEGCVAVARVVRGSAAWAAGLRTQSFISHVDRQRVSTPDEFHAAVTKQTRQVLLTITGDGTEQAVEVTVEASR